MKKQREFWLAMPGKEYDGCPVAWQSKQLAENSAFCTGVDRDTKEVTYEYPSEIVHVIEVIEEE